MHPVFSSIEEWLGLNTDDYYKTLSEVAKGKWSPENSIEPWIKFCLKAHYQQAATLLRRNSEYEKLYAKIETITRKYDLHERTALPLFDSAWA